VRCQRDGAALVAPPPGSIVSALVPLVAVAVDVAGGGGAVVVVRAGVLVLRREPKLALNLLLDEPAKLLEEPPHWPKTPPDPAATGERPTSASRRGHPPSPTRSPARLLMPEVGRPARLLPAVRTGAHAERGVLPASHLRHLASWLDRCPCTASPRNCKRCRSSTPFASRGPPWATWCHGTRDDRSVGPVGNPHPKSLHRELKVDYVTAETSVVDFVMRRSKRSSRGPVAPRRRVGDKGVSSLRTPRLTRAAFVGRGRRGGGAARRCGRRCRAEVVAIVAILGNVSW
jgi:hypothetical protein